MSDDSDTEDLPQLSSETFAALQEFYHEQEIRETKLSEVLATQKEGITLDFDEDWQLSQFWYDEATVDKLTKIIFDSVGPDGSIALVSCPTLYKSVKILCKNVTLFEYDERFAAYGSDFIFYDYKSPLNVPRALGGSFDLVVGDPPFLSDECLTKTAVTLKFLAKHRLILSTGSVMADLALRLLEVKKSKFEPQHKHNLANEFWCFSNYNIDDFL